jgi:hypothetical protein
MHICCTTLHPSCSQHTGVFLPDDSLHWTSIRSTPLSAPNRIKTIFKGIILRVMLLVELKDQSSDYFIRSFLRIDPGSNTSVFVKLSLIAEIEVLAYILINLDA